MTTAFVYTADPAFENVDIDELTEALQLGGHFNVENLTFLFFDPDDLRDSPEEAVALANADVVEYANALHFTQCADVYFYECDHGLVEKIVVDLLRKNANVRMHLQKPKIQMRMAG